MKRVFCLILSVFIMTTMMVGCSLKDQDDFNEIDESKEIEYTASKPLYEYNADILQLFVSFSNHAQADNYDVFNEFYKYYRNKYKNTISYGFYLLKPNDGILGWLPDCLYKEIQIFNKTDNSNYSIIHEYIMLRDEEIKNINSQNTEIEDGKSNSNITLSIFLAPVTSNITGHNYRLEFGNNYDSNFTRYINIYVKETCIATCYYNTSCEVPYKWFSQYFKNNLFKG